MTMITKGVLNQIEELNEMERLKAELLERKASGKFMRWEDFSFDHAQEISKHITGNFSDAIIEERNEGEELS